MIITMKEEGTRFGGRVGAIIYNEDKTKILIEKQKEHLYMFPGGRIDVHEDSQNAISRELKEELNIDASLGLKYILEMFLEIPKAKYHEIGFYFITIIKEDLIEDGFKSLDGDSIYKWVNVSDLNQYNLLAKPIKEKIMNNQTGGNDLEHIVYREY